MKTIGRNRKNKITEIFQNAKNVVSKNIQNNFVGAAVSVEDMQSVYETFGFSKLSVSENGTTGMVEVHSNHWFTFEIGATS